MRILITFAVDAEFAPWRKLRDFRKISAALFEMANEDHKVKVILTGIGREQVGRSFVRSGILSSMTPDAVVSSGLAGALKESMKPGDLIAPQKVRTLRNDANADADCYLRARAIERGASPIESLITMDRIVSTAVEKERL